MPAAARLGRKHRIWVALAAALVLLVLFWDWDWLRPLVESRASAALGREVRMEHFDVDLKLGRHPVIEGEGIVIDNPPGFPEDSRFGEIERLRITTDFWSLFSDVPRLPRIAAERFTFDLRPGPDGQPNWIFEKKDEPKKETKGPAVRVGNLDLREGRVHVLYPPQDADFQLAVRTEGEGESAQLRIDAEGTYGGQPVTGRFIGGSVLNLRESQPYPVDLKAVNGQTHIRLEGVIEDPLQLGAAHLDLVLHGDDLEDLYPLTGIPLPPTPAYKLKGALDVNRERISFQNFQGVVGSSDISGDLTVDLAGKDKRLVKAQLVSNKLFMADLAGFIGAAPGKEGAPGDTTEQKQVRSKDEARSSLLPDRTISLPKIRAADLDVRLHAEHIESDWVPVDDLEAHLVIEDGYLRVKPLRFGVGEGQIAANIELDGRKDVVQTTADVDFRRLNLSRIMQETRMFEGAGLIGGIARLTSNGNSLAEILGHGDGELKLFMTEGRLDALLVNLAGLEFGNALLSALGLPNKTEIRCLVTDLALDDGVLKTRTMVLDTGLSNLFVTGTINLRNEALNLELRAQPKRFGLGTLKSPIEIDGTLKKPDLGLQGDELAARGGAAAALGALLGPLAALVPTINLGLGEDHNCKALIESVNAAGSVLERGGVAPPQADAPSDARTETGTGTTRQPPRSGQTEQSAGETTAPAAPKQEQEQEQEPEPEPEPDAPAEASPEEAAEEAPLPFRPGA